MIKQILQASAELHQQLIDDDHLQETVTRVANACKHAIQSNNKIIFCGNGGSFADAQHITAEFVGRFLKDRQALPALTLGCNLSSTTAISNDYHFETIFSRELLALGQPGDVLIGITTSGNSANVLNAIDVALEKEIHAFGFTGNKKGQITSKCPCIEIPSDSTARIQECHILVGHIICELVDHALIG